MANKLEVKREGASHSKVFAWFVFHKTIEDLKTRSDFDLGWKRLTIHWHDAEPNGRSTQTRQVVFVPEYQYKEEYRFEVQMQGSFNGAEMAKWTYADVIIRSKTGFSAHYRFNAGAISRVNEQGHMEFVGKFACDSGC